MVKKGTVLFGINNIFTVQAGSSTVECRIKGKILGEGKREYNPLAPGDRVFFKTDPINPEKGMILERCERRNAFLRWNKKRRAPQAIAANIDGIVCISSPESPPFRPRFIDRVAVTSSIHSIPFTVILNKNDQKISGEILERIRYYENIGISVYTCSAKTGENIDAVMDLLAGKVHAFIGQSGVGKSTLLNKLCGTQQQKTGAVSLKYNRGIHTTIFSALILCMNNIRIIDTPGIREIEIYGIDPSELSFHFPEFEKYAHICSFPGCTHIHEPKCGVRTAVADGSILEDRYESYTRIYDSLKHQREASYE